MDLDNYINSDGTYTSPKNGKIYKNKRALRSHLNGRFQQQNSTTRPCQYCQRNIQTPNLTKHEKMCFMNPDNVVQCQTCGTPIKNYRISKGTCSRSCANRLFRKGEDNGNWKGTRYQSICFNHHEKCCIVCGEDKIVTVHHIDENHNNNDPVNLVPLCPTHHQYMHSRYWGEVQPYIDKYLNKNK